MDKQVQGWQSTEQQNAPYTPEANNKLNHFLM